MSYNILLVDDDSFFRREFRGAFPEYRIIEAANGREAVEILGKPNEIDLVLLDVLLPDIRGTEVLREIKRAAPDLTVVILTGHGSKDVAVQALRGRADDYIEKPFAPEQARSLIAKLLQGQKHSEALEAGGIRARIEHVRKFILRNAHKNVSLKEAAATVFLSPKYLSRIFKEVTGTGFTRFCLETKLAEAKKILAETEYTVERISRDFGYLNKESFIRIFHKYARCTPTAYRTRARKETGGRAKRGKK